MEYIGIGIIVAALIAIGIILYTKLKKKYGPPFDTIGDNTPFVKDKGALAEIHQADKLVIQMDMLPVDAIEDETKLVEITDSKVLSHVNNLVPGLAQAGNAVNNAAHAIQAANGEVL